MSKKILLLGSGMMAETVIDLLLKRPENSIQICSNLVEDGKKLAAKKERCQADFVDVTSAESLRPFVKDSNLVISYVPATFHFGIAKVCLEEGKHLVTASYVSEEMKQLDKAAKEKGLTFLNECGLDPGIDHLATMKILDEEKEKGSKVLEYESWCGGLPSPEFIDNPIGYKFTWTPIGALGALSNDAQFLENGKVIKIKGDDLQYHTKPLNINMGLNLEGYPNRDSLAYKDLYQLKDAKKIQRGTLRFAGFGTIINSMKALDLLKKDQVVQQTQSYRDYIFGKVKNCKITSEISEILKSANVQAADQEILGKVLAKAFSHDYYKKNPQKKKENGKQIVTAYTFFNLISSKKQVTKGVTNIQNTVDILNEKLALSPGETDMVVMQHIFVIQEKSGRIIQKKSTMVNIGEKNGKTAMAITVGTPTAIGAQLILDGIINEPGVQIPNKKSIYEPINSRLEAAGIKCIESEEVTGQIKPKL